MSIYALSALIFAFVAVVEPTGGTTDSDSGSETDGSDSTTGYDSTPATGEGPTDPTFYGGSCSDRAPSILAPLDGAQVTSPVQVEVDNGNDLFR